MDEWLDGLGSDPHAVLARWLAEARAAELFEPEAAALATATPDGAPSVRMVLVRGIDARGVVFYTNRQSRKGRGKSADDAHAGECTRPRRLFKRPPAGYDAHDGEARC